MILRLDLKVLELIGAAVKYEMYFRLRFTFKVAVHWHNFWPQNKTKLQNVTYI